jgi:hypothetical protein
MTGFTSVIFGILVRLRAPLLPFFLLLLTIEPKQDTIVEQDEPGESLETI